MTHRIARGLLVATGVFCVLLWLALLVLGLTVDSKPYRAALLTGFDPILLIQVALFYTPINVALLTCLAGLIGGISSNLTFHPATPPAETAAAEMHRALVRTENPFASLLRSFVVYLLFIAGIAITTDAPFSNPTADQYMRIAGLLSLIGFVVGYDPSTFNGLLRRVPMGGGK
ncbi:MAG: hypothetical protein ACREXW_06935 [Gammaproteobacteria bacterium]